MTSTVRNIVVTIIVLALCFTALSGVFADSGKPDALISGWKLPAKDVWQSNQIITESGVAHLPAYIGLDARWQRYTFDFVNDYEHPPVVVVGELYRHDENQRYAQHMLQFHPEGEIRVGNCTTKEFQIWVCRKPGRKCRIGWIVAGAPMDKS